MEGCPKHTGKVHYSLRDERNKIIKNIIINKDLAWPKSRAPDYNKSPWLELIIQSKT